MDELVTKALIEFMKGAKGMALRTTGIFFDAQRIWREDNPGCLQSINWCDIRRLVGWKSEQVRKLFVCVTFETDDEHIYLDIDDKLPGFEATCLAITRRFPGISPEWYSRLRASPAVAGKMVIWPTTGNDATRSTESPSQQTFF